MAIAALSETYAAACVRADGRGVAALFLPEGRMVVEPAPPAEAQVLTGRDAIAARIDSLRRYDYTAHLIGDHTVAVDPDGQRATGTRACVAHHVGGEAGEGADRVVTLTYHDTYALGAAGWALAERVVRFASETFEVYEADDASDGADSG